MKTVNLCKPILSLSGEPIKSTDGTIAMINEAVANILVSVKADDKPIRQYELALKINQAKGDIEIEDADLERIKRTINRSQATTLVSGQIMQILDAKE